MSSSTHPLLLNSPFVFPSTRLRGQEGLSVALHGVHSPPVDTTSHSSVVPTLPVDDPRGRSLSDPKARNPASGTRGRGTCLGGQQTRVEPLENLHHPNSVTRSTERVSGLLEPKEKGKHRSTSSPLQTFDPSELLPEVTTGRQVLEVRTRSDSPRTGSRRHRRGLSFLLLLRV